VEGTSSINREIQGRERRIQSSIIAIVEWALRPKQEVKQPIASWTSVINAGGSHRKGVCDDRVMIGEIQAGSIVYCGDMKAYGECIVLYCTLSRWYKEE
jgi:hypothetical protein